VKTHTAFGWATQVVVLDEKGALERVIAAHDVGRAINPQQCEAQVEGSVHMGLGYALTEELPCKDGMPVTFRLRDIGVLRAQHMPAVDVMNYVLGGGSFSSRITKVVRTDNGLAYSTSSSMSGGALYPGTFAAFCQTKNPTVVFASQLMLDLIEGMRAGDVSQADLDFARTARVEAFPATFGSMSQTLSNFAQLEYYKRPLDYYDTLRAKYEKLTLADIKKAAQKWLRPEKMVIMVAGNIDECKAGADKMLPNQATIDAMAAKFGGRTMDGLAKKYGDGTVNVVTLK